MGKYIDGVPSLASAADSGRKQEKYSDQRNITKNRKKVDVRPSIK